MCMLFGHGVHEVSLVVGTVLDEQRNIYVVAT
jgi:hypothetical protein